ncbi:hypothetical protein, partial [Neoroseomonas rubea]|uniref:hypothetical protein n=1 Tax=Neoroseomonas rubea TaxID=2748666 RepID=UPI0018E04C13
MDDTMREGPAEDPSIDGSEDAGTSNPEPRLPIGEIIAARYGRRGVLAAGAAAAALAARSGEHTAELRS